MATLNKRLRVVIWTVLSLSFLLTGTATAATGDQPSYTIGAVEWEQNGGEFVLRVKGDTPPTYTMYELFEPLRVVIDVADASINPSANLPMDLAQAPISRVTGLVLEDKEPFIARLELYLSADNSYTVERIDNDIVVRLSGGDAAGMAPAPAQEIAVEDLAPEITAEVIDVPAEAIPNIALNNTEPAPTSSPATVLFDIEVERTPTQTLVYLKADGTIGNYRKVQLSKNVEADRPDRMYIDVKNVRLSGKMEPKEVGTALARIRTGQRTDGFRVVFDSSLDTLFDYTISKQSDGLLITINEPSAATAVIADIIDDSGIAAAADPAMAPEPEMFAVAEEPAPAPVVEAAPAPKETASRAVTMFSGYNKQRITVDFYKIDLHNVFRLFGEISNLNMVVDEAVNGSLTLALNDVPWDFALDIILNLKDLQKEERYNTIVISPKDKEFNWPERSLDNVEITVEESDDKPATADGKIRVSEVKTEVRETVVEAKKLIHQAQSSERFGNYAAALPLYEDALAKWPENIIIAKRIAAICLVHLGQNAKAVHYAKVALRANPNDYDSALQAAIGLARMQKFDEAEEMFNVAIGGTLPLSGALSSYAAFCEEQGKLDKALEILKRHEDIHGDTLETMISKARIHDKQGQRDVATAEYQAILLSGYEIPPDLARYIKGRAAMAN